MAAESIELHSSQLYPKLDTLQEQSIASNHRLQIVFKILELILCIACIILIYHSEITYDVPLLYLAVCCITYGSFFVLSLAFLIEKSTGSKSSWNLMDSISSWIAIVLFIFCAYQLMMNREQSLYRGLYQDLRTITAASVLSLITAGVYLTEFILQYKKVFEKKTLSN